jgi:hypothetical protein
MYTTIADLNHAAGGADRLVELADWDGDGVADPAVLERAQLAADGFVDAHLRRFSAEDLAALRASPTETIKRIAAEETIYQIRRQRPASVTEDDEKHREWRTEELRDMRADKLRAKDTKTPRAVFIENDGEFSRKKFEGC